MKKGIFFILIAMMSIVVVFSQEVALRVNKVSPYFHRNNYEYAGDLQPGERVYPINVGGFNRIARDEAPTFYTRFTKEGDVRFYDTYSKNLVAFNTEVLFDSDIYINYNNIVRSGIEYYLPNEMWVPVYYCDVLRSRERDTLTKYEPYLLKYNTGKYTAEYDQIEYWYLYGIHHTRNGMTMFYNSMIYTGRSNHFLVRNIIKTATGYKVTCLGQDLEKVEKEGPTFDWSLYSGGEIDFLLNIDGEYLEMYIGDTLQKFVTLVRVKEEFIWQYQNLMEHNQCDLTNVIWPRRADGSMDYPPPQLTQAVPKQPETVTADTPSTEDEDTAAVTPERETLAQQPEIGLPLIVALTAVGLAVVAGAAVFLLRRKRQ
jgi:hypothetical protein